MEWIEKVNMDLVLPELKKYNPKIKISNGKLLSIYTDLKIKFIQNTEGYKKKSSLGDQILCLVQCFYQLYKLYQCD